MCVRCADEAQLLAIAQTASTAGVNHGYIRDAGRTEVEDGTITVLAVGPDSADQLTPITGQLKLY